MVRAFDLKTKRRGEILLVANHHVHIFGDLAVHFLCFFQAADGFPERWTPPIPVWPSFASSRAHREAGLHESLLRRTLDEFRTKHRCSRSCVDCALPAIGHRDLVQCRELPRTIQSLAPPMQRDIAREEFEIIVVDNGSNPPIDERACGLGRQYLLSPHGESQRFASSRVNFGLHRRGAA